MQRECLPEEKYKQLWRRAQMVWEKAKNLRNSCLWCVPSLLQDGQAQVAMAERGPVPHQMSYIVTQPWTVSILLDKVRKRSCKGLGSEHMAFRDMQSQSQLWFCCSRYKEHVTQWGWLLLHLVGKVKWQKKLGIWAAVRWPLVSITIVLPWHSCSVGSTQDALPPRPAVPAKMGRPEGGAWLSMRILCSEGMSRP